MSSNIVLPSLTNWAKNHLSAIVDATTRADLDAALDAFLSKSATFTVNGVDLSRDQYTAALQRGQAAGTISFGSSIEVPADSTKPVEAGSVALFCVIDITEAPKQNKFTSSLNMVIEQDPAIPVPPPGPIHGFSDRRRVMALNRVTAKEAPPTNA